MKGATYILKSFTTTSRGPIAWTPSNRTRRALIYARITNYHGVRVARGSVLSVGMSGRPIVTVLRIHCQFGVHPTRNCTRRVEQSARSTPSATRVFQLYGTWGSWGLMKSYNHELFSGVCTHPLMWLIESFSRSKKETESMFCVGRKLIYACPWTMVGQWCQRPCYGVMQWKWRPRDCLGSFRDCLDDAIKSAWGS